MMDKENFNSLIEQIILDPGKIHMRPVIEKEILHYDILFCLERDGLLDDLTFQGGTSLRLCYNSSRFSEDLDFTGGKDFSSGKLSKIKDSIEKYIGDRYQLEVTVKEPKELKDQPEYEFITVDKWQISIVTNPGDRSIPKQRIKIEVANVDSYSRNPKSITLNYNFLPDGYSDILIMTETLDEIMVDKIVSLVCTKRYVRNRDIWDLRWLKQQGAQIKGNWLKNKFEDYNFQDCINKIHDMQNRLPDIITGKKFKDEITRFIPTEVIERTISKDKFSDFLISEVDQILNQAKESITEQNTDEEFSM